MSVEIRVDFEIELNLRSSVALNSLLVETRL
jgi:hypothetical protein